MHETLGKIEDVNIAIDDGEDGWVRMVIVPETGSTVSALIPKDVAESMTLDLSAIHSEGTELNSSQNL